MSLVNNYSVTYAEAISAGILANGTWPYATNKCLTKYDCQTYLFCDSSYLTTYSSNQLVPYQNIVAAPTYTLSFQAHIQSNVINNICGFWYQLAGTWTRWQITSISTQPSYSTLSSFTIPQGATIYLGVQNASNVNLVFGTGNGGAYAGYCGQSAPYSVTPSGNTTYYFNISTNGSSLRTC